MLLLKLKIDIIDNGMADPWNRVYNLVYGEKIDTGVIVWKEYWLHQDSIGL